MNLEPAKLFGYDETILMELRNQKATQVMTLIILANGKTQEHCICLPRRHNRTDVFIIRLTQARNLVTLKLQKN